MKVEQIYDNALAHASYAILSDKKVALVDPARDPQPYIDFAEKHNAEIVAVFETHPHADFASSHLELSQKLNIPVYINPKVGVNYEFTALEHGDEVKIGKATIKTLFTPGHSPDHNSYLLLDEDGKEVSVFTGDSLFVGDVGRPDLREGAGNIQVSRKELAGMMYDTVNNIFNELEDGVTVYPAHGPGSLCGKNMSPDLYSTIGKEKQNNWAFQIKEKDNFINSYLEGQSFIPKYFPYEVELNRNGAVSLNESINKALKFIEIDQIEDNSLIIDVRPEANFKSSHIAGAINIQMNSENAKFETWLGSIVSPDEEFYLAVDNKAEGEKAVRRAAKIGYETKIKGVILQEGQEGLTSDKSLDLAHFKKNPEAYNIVDIRNVSEVNDGKFFENAVNIPLPELRERTDEIDTSKPIVVHCAGGYRSAAGASIISNAKSEVKVYDLSEAINDFK